METRRTLLLVLQEEQKRKISGGIYHKLQIELTFNSNHMEGSSLTQEQTRYIYETNSISPSEDVLQVDDILETANHFRCIDRVISFAQEELSEKIIKELHFILKNGTSDSGSHWFAVGAYKTTPNEVGGRETTPPQEVAQAMKNLLAGYNDGKEKNFEDIVAFHHDFEVIHPFQDGNGRVGRLILLKECLKNKIVPFVIDENLKLFYYRGLSQWNKERGYLLDTCLTAQDQFRQYLAYFQILEG